MYYQEITPLDDPALAELIRSSLKEHDLALPGTVYYDDGLNHLSDFYLSDAEKRFYYILHGDDGQLIGGIGLAEFDCIPGCAELQKLYLAASERGKGIGYELISRIENKARELGYQRIYLETHTNLPAAIHIYEKSGFRKIERPVGVVHAAMNRFYLKEL